MFTLLGQYHTRNCIYYVQCLASLVICLVYHAVVVTGTSRCGTTSTNPNCEISASFRYKLGEEMVMAIIATRIHLIYVKSLVINYSTWGSFNKAGTALVNQYTCPWSISVQYHQHDVALLLRDVTLISASSSAFPSCKVLAWCSLCSEIACLFVPSGVAWMLSQRLWPRQKNP